MIIVLRLIAQRDLQETFKHRLGPCDMLVSKDHEHCFDLLNKFSCHNDRHVDLVEAITSVTGPHPCRAQGKYRNVSSSTYCILKAAIWPLWDRPVTASCMQGGGFQFYFQTHDIIFLFCLAQDHLSRYLEGSCRGVSLSGHSLPSLGLLAS